MRNPLRKRYLRELKADFGKYFVIFAFMVGMIGIVSGYLVSGDSLKHTLEESFEIQNIEDGNFELLEKATENQIINFEEESLTVYENFYVEDDTIEIDSRLRIFNNREDVNKVVVLEGELPTVIDEIAIDRMYAQNNGLKLGNTISVEDKSFRISGLVALSDYSTLFINNNDMMFVAFKFGVAIASPSGFQDLGSDNLHYSYSWKYNEPPESEEEEVERSEEFLEVINENAILLNYIPQYTNQAIHFTIDDMGADIATFEMFLYIIIIILAFVIAITTATTIASEARIIGTIRATGYTRKELLIHYMTLPIVTILVATIVGNIVGYTWLKDYMAQLYYNSYSLPPYETLWNMDAFIMTSVIPVCIMIVIVALILMRKLRLSPLRFIRRELSLKERERVFPLSPKIRIFRRFRLRIIFQNAPNYMLIFIGVLLANLIMLFGFLFNPLLDRYSEDIIEHKIAEYQYILKAEVPTENEDAELYAIQYLQDENSPLDNEQISVFGIGEDSDYVDVKSDTVYISDAYSKKYDIQIGDILQMSAVYDDEEYTIGVEGILEYPGALSIFMDIDSYRTMFELEEDFYNGYFSDTEIEDVEASYIATTITEDDLVKVSRQLKHSMGTIMQAMVVFGAIIFVLLIYLLSKIVIEKNSQNISLAKILGYSNKEINKLYIMTNTLVTFGSIIITLPICNYMLEKICDMMFADYPQYFPYYMPSNIFLQVIGMGVLTYSIIAFWQVRRAKRIPLDLALKNVE